MTRSPRTTTTFLAIVVAAIAVGGCGSEEPEGEKLPAGTATELDRQLTSIGDRVADRSGGACDDIFDPDPEVGNIGPVDAAMAEVPANVDPAIRAALEQSIDRLKRLVDEECEEIHAEDERQQQEEEVIPEEDLTPPTTPTTEEPVETQPTTPEEETEPPPEEEPDEETPPGNGPDGQGPPGQDGGGSTAPSDESPDG